MVRLDPIALIDDTKYDLVCMGPGCGKPLPLSEAFFCSQECCDLYREPDFESLSPQEQIDLDSEHDIRDARMDRLREEDPSRHIVPVGKVVLPEWA